MAEIIYFRMVQKSYTGKPTVPPSPSHDTGDWTANDIYEQELYVDETTKKLYTRVGSTIIQLNSKPSFVAAIDFVDGGVTPPTEVDDDVYVLETDFPKMTVATITYMAGTADTVRYNITGDTDMLDSASVGDWVTIDSAADPVHNGTFKVTSISAGSWFKVSNPLVTDGTHNDGGSTAIAQITNVNWDGAKINDVVEYQSTSDSWIATTPEEGQTIINKADFKEYVFNGTTWLDVAGLDVMGTPDTLAMFGPTGVGVVDSFLKQLSNSVLVRDGKFISSADQSIQIEFGNGAYYKVTTDAGAGSQSTIYLDSTHAQIASVDGSVYIAPAFMLLQHSAQIMFDAPALNFPQLDVDTVPYLDASKNLVSSAVTPTQLSYLDASSSIQTQLNGKEPTIAAGTTAQYWRGDKTWRTLETANVTEMTNLYFTEARVLATVLAGLSVSGSSISSSDSVLQSFGKLQNQINGVLGGAIFQSTWNAASNSPALSSGSGTKGYYYVVNFAGSTNLDGITDWAVGDWAIYDGTVWRKVDNTDAVSSVNSAIGAVSLIGTTNRITVSGVIWDIAATYIGQSSITTLGTIATGVWNGTIIGASYIATLNQNTTGSAASLSISGVSGLLSFTGLSGSNRIKTIRDAADTILELGGSYTPTGTWTSLSLVTPALGTPASGVLSNCTAATQASNTNNTTIATTAYVDSKADYNILQFESGAWVFTNATTFYVADVRIAPNSTASNYNFSLPYAIVITDVVISAGNNSVSGSVNTSVAQIIDITTSTSSLLGNIRTDGSTTLIKTSPTFSGLSISIPANDKFALRIDTGTLAVVPVGCLIFATITFKRA